MVLFRVVMEKKGFESIDAYLAAQPESTRAVLERVRGAIRKALPDAEEVISYGIPAFREGGRAVIFFAGWKEHFSLYPVTEGIRAELSEELAPYPFSKGTIRFPLAGRVPVGLIGRIARLLARAARERAAERRKPASA